MGRDTDRRVGDGARDSEDPEVRQAWRRQLLKDELKRRSLKRHGHPVEPIYPGMIEARTMEQYWLSIGTPPQLSEFTKFANRVSVPLPEAPILMAGQYGLDTMMGMAKNRREQSVVVQGLQDSKYRKISMREQRQIIDALTQLADWGQTALDNPKLLPDLRDAHRDREHNDRVHVKDVAAGTRLREARTNVEQDFTYVYDDGEAATAKFDELVTEHGVEAAAQQVIDKPGILGSVKGGRLPFTNIETPDRRRANRLISNRLQPDLGSLKKAHGEKETAAKRLEEAGGERPVDQELLDFEIAVTLLKYQLEAPHILGAARNQLAEYEAFNQQLETDPLEALKTARAKVDESRNHGPSADDWRELADEAWRSVISNGDAMRQAKAEGVNVSSAILPKVDHRADHMVNLRGTPRIFT